MSRTDPKDVDLEALYETITDPTKPPSVHTQRIDLIRVVARQCAGDYERFVDPIVALLDRPSMDENESILLCLRQLAIREPVAVFEHAERIRAEVTVESTPVTRAALGVCAELVEADPHQFIGLIDALGALVNVDDEAIRDHSAWLIGRLAESHPEVVAPLSGEIVRGIEHQSTGYQSNVLRALGKSIGFADDPSNALEAATKLLDSPDSTVRGNAFAVLADVSYDHPNLVEPHLSKVISALEDSEADVRANAATVVIHVAQVSPASCAPSINPLIALLEDPTGAARRNACTALGHLEAEDAYDALQKRSVFDPDDGVRSRAKWAAKRVL